MSRTDRFNFIPSARDYQAENVSGVFPEQLLEQYIQFLFPLHLIQHNEYPAAALRTMTLGSIHGVNKETSKFCFLALFYWSLHQVFNSNRRGWYDRWKIRCWFNWWWRTLGRYRNFLEIKKIIWNHVILKMNKTTNSYLKTIHINSFPSFSSFHEHLYTTIQNLFA